MKTIHDRMVGLDRKRDLFHRPFLEDLTENDARYRLRSVEARCVFEAGERYPRDHAEIDKIDPVRFNVECFQTLVFFDSHFAGFVEIKHIALHFEIGERERFVVVQDRLRRVDAVKFYQPAPEDPYPELAYLVRGGHDVEQSRE